MNKKCEICGNEFKTYQYLLKKGKGKVCGVKCAGLLHSKQMKGRLSGCWKGGVIISQRGYVYIWKPKHPNSDTKGYVSKHRLVMEKYLGRYLTKNEVVHHIDKNKLNNNINNLKLFSSHSEHMKYHKK